MKNLSNLKLILLIPFSFALFSCGSKTEINLNDYIEIRYSGYETTGKATANIDIEQMIKDNPKAFGLTDGKSTNAECEAVGITLNQYIDGKISNYDNLSNGDTVSFTWNDDINKIEEMYDIKIKNDNIIQTVSGLEALKEINPFEYYDVSFVGSEPYIAIHIERREGIPVLLEPIPDKFSELKKGETVKITVGTGNDRTVDEECLLYGYKCTQYEEEYKVTLN